MTKRKIPDSRKRRSTPSEVTAAREEPNWLSSAAMRETIESVIIAFVLAFLFRTFEAEAFVIPTGSMAPTLMGKHKDVECPICHYRYSANSSDRSEGQIPLVVSTTCPMCRYTLNVSPNNPQHKDYDAYDGDRILVAKFPYELADPKPWDVVVFKYPGDSTMNYIKRLVGIPGDTIRIHNGDLWIHRPKPGQPDTEFPIARKPPEKILAMLQPVYDNDLAPAISGELGWPARWTADESPDDYLWINPADAKGNEDLSRFKTKGSGKGEAWIRYRHRVPSGNQWAAALPVSGNKLPGRNDRQEWVEQVKARLPAAKNIPPQLISDFTAYNTSVIASSPPLPPSPNGVHWVGDLAVQFELEANATSGTVIAALIKGGRRFQCSLNLASGEAALSISGDEAEAKSFKPTAKTPIKDTKRHTVIFSNVDDQLRLWVDGALVKFGDDRGTADDAATAFDSGKLPDHIPTQDDLSPVRIGASDGAIVDIRHVKVLRDIYYIADARHGLPSQDNRRYPWDDMVRQPPNPPLTDFTDRFANLADSRDWQTDFAPGNMWTVEVNLKPRNLENPSKDQFFVLGDNSAQSQDGRLWRTDPNYHGNDREFWVDRELFIGKALFIYWPHGWKIPYVPLPFNPIPNFRRMHLVR
jgi:signal peptidase I